MWFLSLVVFLDADEEEKTSGSAEHWEERIDISRCAAPRGRACHPEKSSARSCWCKELRVMAMQVEAWQAGWDAEAAHFCPLWWADQNHETYPVATMVAKGKDHQDCRPTQWAHHIPLYYHRSLQLLEKRPCPCCPESGCSPSWAVSSISPVMTQVVQPSDGLLCCSIISKVSDSISPGSFKFYAEISKWPTETTSFVFEKNSVRILVFG